jgi:hypothetical protein
VKRPTRNALYVILVLVALYLVAFGLSAYLVHLARQ